MYSKDLKKKAKDLGLWDGKGPLKFWKVAGGGRKPFSIREWFVLSTLAPSLGLSLDDEEIPFSVKPEVPVTPERILAFYRETYEGTDLDMGKNLKIKAHRRIKNPNSPPCASDCSVSPLYTSAPAIVANEAGASTPSRPSTLSGVPMRAERPSSRDASCTTPFMAEPPPVSTAPAPRRCE